MGLSAITDGETIVPAMFNGIQAGSTGSATTDANGDITVGFPLEYAAKPSVVAIRKSSGSSQKAVHVAAVTETYTTFTCTDDDARQISVSGIVVHWVAAGDLL